MAQANRKNIKAGDGLNLYYETYNLIPGKTPIFFLHGIGGDLDAWQYVLDPILKSGFSAIAMDLRGHGHSSHPRKFASYKVKNLVEDIVSIMEAENVSKIIPVGHCYGAVVAMNFAAGHPEKTASLAVIAGTNQPPPYLRFKILRKAVNVLINFFSLISPPPYKPKHSIYPPGKFHKDYEWAGLAKTILHNSPRSYLLTTKEIVNINIDFKLAAIKAPTLIIAGEKDTIFSLRILKNINTKILNSKLKIVLNANHVLVLNNIKEVSDLLAAFLNSSV